ncbi:hypothetical protein N431DRAFT_206860 [Stipitochalara longipes BDJ]|nr:hypothetical protein N431DRAFT_206860 [Stipitochalara longipes BDJ]
MAQQSAERRTEIYREIHFMKKHLEDHPIPDNAPMRIPAALNDITRAPTPPTPLTTPTPTPKRKQYHRYIDEAEESDTIHLNKAKLLGARLKSEYEAILDDIARREKERLRLLKKLGIRNVNEIPGLMPNRQRSENPRVQFGQCEEMDQSDMAS